MNKVSKYKLTRQMLGEDQERSCWIKQVADGFWTEARCQLQNTVIHSEHNPWTVIQYEEKEEDYIKIIEKVCTAIFMFQ